MILGISGIPLSFCCGLLAIPLGIAAVVTGIVSLNQMKAAGSEQGRGQAIAGICCGAAALVLPIALIALQVSVSSFLG